MRLLYVISTVLAILKLFDLIQISWWLVFMPVIIDVAVVSFIILLESE